ncbi:substrate-binding domain-containing protein [Cohnella mopanensis]|uniref:substrate-binding domain-containing protein n=1 Tax=Cohnella mopanensis TaxID=2911966 RepID=UPI001EF82B75|nr:substrate-binding domain-containing protein [Cohnella mopanensis]
MFTRKKVLLIGLLLTGSLFIILFGFFNFAPKKASDVKPKILIVTKTSDPNVEFWQALAAGTKVAAKEFGVDIEIVGPRTESDVEGQINLLNTIVNYGPLPDAIILAPIDYEKMIPTIEKIIKAGIELVTIDSSVKGGLSSSAIYTDNIAAGDKAGTEAAALLSSSSRVAIINSDRESSSLYERESGVRQAFARFPGIHIMDTYFCNGEEEKAYEITKKLLSGNDPVDGIITLNETATQGAARAVKDLGLQRGVKLVGFDSSIQGISQLEEGELQAIVVQKPFNMGYLAVKSSVKVLNKMNVDSHIDTGSEVITQANMYTDENEKLLFPFGER